MAVNFFTFRFRPVFATLNFIQMRSTSGEGAPGSTGASILIVDDVPANLLAMEAVLQPLGQRIVRARSGQDALKALLDEEFAVILLDVTMPGMDGFETAKLIRERSKTSGVPIIFLTAVHADEQFVARAYERGAVDYLIKPFDPEILRAKVAVFVELYLMRERMRELAALEARRQEVETARARLLSIVTQLPVPICLLRGREQVFELVNPRFEALMGGRSVIGRRLRDAFANLPAEVFAELEAVLDRGTPAQERRPLTIPDGAGGVATRWYDYALQPFRRHDGTVEGVLACVTDVTREVVARERDLRAQAEREQLLEELKAALRTRDDFLMVASHELRTPLTSLQLTASSVLRQVDKAGGHPLPAPLVTDRMRGIKRQLDRLEQLISALLDVSRIGARRLELQLETVDLGEVVQEVLARMRDEAARQRVTATVEVMAGIKGTWDRSRLDQIVTNLVSNAIKYGAGKPIDVSVTRSNGDAELRVRDRGIGIAPEQQERIFGKFERAASQRNYGGLGLGLWITRQLVDLMHGSVRVESTPGEGATFIVKLPTQVN